MTGLSTRIQASLEGLAREGVVADWTSLHLPGNRPPFTETALTASTGDAITWLAEGELVISEALDWKGGPRFHLWGRIGPDGRIRCGTRETTTFRAEADGPLELGVYQGEWADTRGTLLTPPEDYATLEGGFEVVAIRWPQADAATVRAGLARLLEESGGDALVRRELERFDHPVAAPAGWHYLWFLGESEIFRSGASEGRPTIEIDVDADVGILQRPLARPVAATPELALSWRWRVDELPSVRSEDQLLQHDYLSIAVEFDCGRDVTWMWSTDLPREHTFTCPIPAWAPRETHVVRRTREDGLGVWHTEQVHPARDYERIHGKPPGQAVGVWLIAVSLFQRGRGRAVVADIALSGSDADAVPLVPGGG